MRKIFLSVFIFLGCFSVFGFPDILSAWDDITKTDFTISVGTIAPGWTSLIGDNSTETVDNVLTTILNKLILVFGVVAVFIMTIGAGYMIIYHWQDEFLSKWKSIFLSGIISLAIALSAWVIVNLFKYLLY